MWAFKITNLELQSIKSTYILKKKKCKLKYAPDKIMRK